MVSQIYSQLIFINIIDEKIALPLFLTLLFIQINLQNIFISYFLTGGIEDIRQKLFQLSCNFQQNNIYHPKIITACKEVEKCFQFRNNSEKKV